MDNKAGYSKETATVDALVAGGAPLKATKVTIPDGTAALDRGTLMGKITTGAISQAFAGTGNGVLSALAKAKKAVAGDYKVRCHTAASDGGIFSVVAPDGTRLGDAIVGTAYANDHLAFSIADGSTDFTVGATFTLTVAAGSGKCIKSLAAAVDGSNVPVGILAEDTPALSGADGEALMYTAGDFLASEMTFGTGHTSASVKDGLHDQGIFLH